MSGRHYLAGATDRRIRSARPRSRDADAAAASTLGICTRSYLTLGVVPVEDALMGEICFDALGTTDEKDTQENPDFPRDAH